MDSKEVRNTIIGLIVLVIGIFFVIRISEGFISQYLDQFGSVSVPGGLANSVTGIGTLILLGCLALAILLIPLWLYMRRKEKKKEEKEKHLELQRKLALQRKMQLAEERKVEASYEERLRERQKAAQKYRDPHYYKKSKEERQ